MKKIILVVMIVVFAFTSNAQMVHEKGTVHMEVNASVGIDTESEFEGNYAAIGMHAGVEFAVMYNVADWFSAGIGLGIGEHIYAETYDDDADYDTTLTIPLMFKTKFTPGNGRVGFVARIDGGIEFAPDIDTDEKLFVAHPQIGVGFHGLNSSFNLLGGIRSTFVADTSINYVTFGIGWAF